MVGPGPPAGEAFAATGTRGDVARAVAENRTLLVILVLFTAVVLWPDGSVPAWQAPEARVALETSRSLITFAAAGLLTMIGGTGRDRAGFIVALLLLGVTDLVFGVVPSVVNLADPPDTILPWVTGRYMAGVMFVLVGLERPRWPLRRALVVVALLYAIVQLATVWLLPAPSPAELGGPRPPAADVALELGPMVLFAGGAVLASRLHVRDGEPLDRWLAASLLVGAFTQVHEAAFPVGLGPIVSSADLLRAMSAMLLLVGATQQVKRLRSDRIRALALSQADVRELRVVSDRLQSYVAQEASFRSVVTHELATPVATISACAHLLAATDLSEDGATSARTIADEARRLRALIERMDELTGIDTDTLTVEVRSVTIVPLLDEAAAFGRASPGNHPVSVHADDQVLQLDPTRMSQVLRNLVGNATRYTPPETPIRLSGRSTPAGYEVVVSDEGPGFGVSDAEAVLAKYRRGPSGDRVDGTGLGLWIVREIVAAHGGHVALVEPDAPGARISVVIPTTASRVTAERLQDG